MSVTVLSKSRDLSQVEEYLMTISPAIKIMNNVPDGTVIAVDAVLLFEDTKENGESTEIMSVMTPNREVYSAQSATFKRSINDIMNIMNGTKFSIIKTSGVTKTGRPFINCELDISSAM